MKCLLSSLMLLVVLLCAGCGRSPAVVDASTGSGGSVPGRIAAPAGALKQIRTAEVQMADIPMDEVVAPGKVQMNPNRISRITTPTAGKIASVEVRLGDSVSRGQALLSVESPEAEAAVSDCLRAEAGQTQSESALAKARKDLERARDLYERGAAPEKDVLNAQAEVARNESEVKEAGAVWEQTQRRVTILGLSSCKFGQKVVVRAPIAGKILEINAVPGEYKSDTAAPLMTVADLRSVWVASGVPESSIRLIRPGERVTIELTAYPGEELRGSVKRVADTVDPVTRSVEVLTELENPAGRFRPEMFARIRHSHGMRRVPVAPAPAVVQAEGRAWVFVARPNGEFEKVAVETGEAAGTSVPILSGLRAGDRIAVDGAIFLQGMSGGSH